MPRIAAHVRRNVAVYVALFATLGGTSYAAVALTPVTVRTAAVASGAVTPLQLARHSVGDDNGRDGRPPTDASDPGAPSDGQDGPPDGQGDPPDGRAGPPDGKGDPSDGQAGPPDGKGGPSDGKGGPSNPGGAAEPGNISARARGTSVVAKHGGATDIPLSGNTWTQAAQELELVAGTVKFTIPKSCTGGFGNALLLSVDGAATTFASVPGPPTSGTVTVPFLIGTLSEPGKNTDHKLTAKFTDTCSKAGEDYKVDDVKIDVVKFH
jgi:hypothetical protein